MGQIGAAISRNRQQSETKSTFNPDLEYTQQNYATALNGPGAAIGSYGMSGGQYPTVGKDPAGFGSGGYGQPGQYHGTGSNSEGYQGTSDNRSGFQRARDSGFGGTGMMGSASDAAQAFVNGRNQSYWGPGNTGQPGSGSLYYGSQGGGGKSAYGQPGTAGDTGGGQGYGGYSAMAPYQGGGYQFGSEGAMGDINATGAAAYGGYNQLNRAYGRLGSQGVTRGERANLMSASNEAIQSNLGANRDIISNRVAQSGNSAGAYGALARLGASGGQQLEAADRANQTAIMAENQRRKEAGLAGQANVAAGQAGLYSTGTGYASNLLAGRGRLASLQQRGYTQGAGTGGTVSYSGSVGSMGGG